MLGKDGSGGNFFASGGAAALDAGEFGEERGAIHVMDDVIDLFFVELDLMRAAAREDDDLFGEA